MIRKRPYIVITRPEPGLSETIGRVEALGWKALALPVMTVNSLAVYFPDLSNVQAFIFTSRQAIQPTVQQLQNQRIDYSAIPVFTVGDVTASCAEDAGFLKVFSASQDAVKLASLIQNSVSPSAGELLFLSGKGQGQLLVKLLQGAGFTMIQKEVYETHPVLEFSEYFIERLNEDVIHSILFFSSETARFFVDLLTEESRPSLKFIQAIGMSMKVKQQLQRVSWKQIDVARHPNTTEMLSLLKEH